MPYAYYYFKSLPITSAKDKLKTNNYDLMKDPRNAECSPGHCNTNIELYNVCTRYSLLYYLPTLLKRVKTSQLLGVSQVTC